MGSTGKGHGGSGDGGLVRTVVARVLGQRLSPLCGLTPSPSEPLKSSVGTAEQDDLPRFTVGETVRVLGTQCLNACSVSLCVFIICLEE